jgi:hypothetical protein
LNGRNGGIFTGRGYKTTGSSIRVSYQWFGMSSAGPATPGDWDTIPYIGILNAFGSYTSSASITSYGTTAFNGFIDATVGSTTMTGSVTGYIASSDTQPAPVAITQSEHSKLWYIKMLAGTMAIEGRALLSDIQIGFDVNAAIEVSFGYTLIGIPRQAQFNFLAGVVQP